MINKIFVYETLEIYEPQHQVYGNVLFLRNFGPWKAYERYKYIRLITEVGIIQELNEDLEPIKECKIEMVAQEGDYNQITQINLPIKEE